MEEFPTSHHLSGADARFLKKISRLNEISLDFMERCLTSLLGFDNTWDKKTSKEAVGKCNKQPFFYEAGMKLKLSLHAAPR